MSEWITTEGKDLPKDAKPPVFNVKIIPPPKEPTRTEVIGDFTCYYNVHEGQEYCYCQIHNSFLIETKP